MLIEPNGTSMSIPAGQERSFRERASYCSKARSIAGYKVTTKRVSALFVRGTGLDDPPHPVDRIAGIPAICSGPRSRPRQHSAAGCATAAR